MSGIVGDWVFFVFLVVLGIHFGRLFGPPCTIWLFIVKTVNRVKDYKGIEKSKLRKVYEELDFILYGVTAMFGESMATLILIKFFM